MSCSTNDIRRDRGSAYYHNECPLSIKSSVLCAFFVVQHLVFVIQIYCYGVSLYYDYVSIP